MKARYLKKIISTGIQRIDDNMSRVKYFSMIYNLTSSVLDWPKYATALSPRRDVGIEHLSRLSMCVWFTLAALALHAL